MSGLWTLDWPNGAASAGGDDHDPKKPRRSERLLSQSHPTPVDHRAQLPSPVTHQSTATDPTSGSRHGTATPPEGRPSQIHHRSPVSPTSQLLSSPPQETQPLSQFVNPSQSLSRDVLDEEAEGVWGYLMPLDSTAGDTLVLRKRAACPAPVPGDFGTGVKKRVTEPAERLKFEEEEELYERRKCKSGFPASGYLIGRHPECDRVLHLPTISNRHCLIFSENKGGDTIAVLEDLSSNGTFVNEAYVGRNKRRELEENDEITILDETRYIFRYPKKRDGGAFKQQFRIVQQLGKGHFATVYLAIQKSTGERFAVKKFEKRPGETHKTDGLQQEIAVLMSISHPNLLCLRETFDDKDAVYLVLELAPEGELFNWIVMKQKLSEVECRKVFVQLFQATRYLHERGIVHRDVKPENILLVDKDLTVKIADFGLAKIIGEESFTTTLCGTPSYVAPEILENSKHRRYTKAVDIWSLGVVLYICLCGFPPFSDELYTPENPYTLAQQIKAARFDYPSPYWDSVGDPALDLIDKMLLVDPEKRATIEECLEHPWLTQRMPSLTDSTDGLTGAMGSLDFSKRKVARERTLLSSLNEVVVEQVVQDPHGKSIVKIWGKNKSQTPQTNKKPKEKGKENEKEKEKDRAKASPNKEKGKGKKENGKSQEQEEAPAANRDPKEFMEMGGNGDQPLFGYDGESRYTVGENAKVSKQGS
ncbi:MAG: hypothetical protein LQ340_004369 [Diploschistes diacapsis]|nr:MAG: hypothetical protein LQ340_004369 [Diploschistes diacapsis]